MQFKREYFCPSILSAHHKNARLCTIASAQSVSNLSTALCAKLDKSLSPYTVKKSE